MSWTPFDENYAPPRWKPEYEKEPVIFWKYTGKKTKYNNSDEFLNAVTPSSDYNSAKSARDKEIGKWLKN